ncbi:hypothetical protein [Asanoa siamensis]|uniref:Uncharacterized protein n=1 Tax=Asanoa siamensis TaxID=926357 RepID=A0ABQ4D1D5_9ACTN|nr:hypothetical protein [Asanoa siamensis]GIF77356.1 hypothetical protein Asi02nite_68740 [Asanoa siamensis]
MTTESLQRDDLTDLARTGLPAQAQPLDLRETGAYVDREPVLEVLISVRRVDGGPPYPAMYLGPIAEPFLGRAQDGLPFAARIDPQRPDRVLVDWTACAA